MNDLADDHAIAFGPFRLLAKQRLLLEGDRPVRLGSRALGILIALAERPSELVSKRDLMKLVWSGANVLEANIKVNVAELRRALGDGQAGNRYIVNDAGRGYRFVAPIVSGDQPSSRLSPPEAAAPPTNLPAQLTRLVGRSETVGTIMRHFPSERLLTVVGTAGVGKTAVALEAAAQLLPDFAGGVWLIDLAPISDPRQAATAAAANLRIEIRSADPLRELLAAIRDKRMLLVLDNCEHLIDTAAEIAAGILRAARDVAVLATSREPLRVEGERVLKLPPLASPPASVRLSAVEALCFPAAQLFVERATAAVDDFELTDAEATAVGDICRRLEGIPLAIELTAARVGVFGVRGLASRLDDRLRLLVGGRRAALPRSQTLRAALEWSHHLLNEDEQTVFRRLSVFAGGFALEAAIAVAASVDESALDVAEAVASLVMKSLVAADVGDSEVRFRLLETTRVFASDKLAESADESSTRRGHAEYYRDLLVSTASQPGDESASAHLLELDNIRAALNWAFGPEGDAAIGIALASASASAWLETSQLTECHSWMEKALARLEPVDRGTRSEMALQCALGFSHMFTRGTDPEARAALARACEIAESLQDLDYQVRALTGLSLFCIRLEEVPPALAFARRCEAIAASLGDPIATSTADALLGSSLLASGDCVAALFHTRRAEGAITPSMRRANIVRSGLDHAIQAGCVAAQSLWLRGLIDQAAQATQDVLADAEKSDRPLSLCFALVWCGCLVSLGHGDFETAGRSISRLKELSDRYGLASYYACGLGFEGQFLASRGNLEAAGPLLRASLEGLRRLRYEILYTPFLSSLSQMLSAAGRHQDALAITEEALERIERNQSVWWLPEALRIKGEILLQSCQVQHEVVDDLFSRSVSLAHTQRALFFELRSAVSLGRLRDAQGRRDDAKRLVGSVYERFTEGFEAPDLQAAKRLLESWTQGA